MTEQTKLSMTETVRSFYLPRYSQIPDVGLYLDQAVRFISQALSPLGEMTLTGSMISNYVKKGLVASPVRKLYNREQIAHLLFIALAKSVLSLDSLQEFIRLRQRTYAAQTAYDYLCLEFENVLHYVFGLKESLDHIGVDHTDEKQILRSTIIAVCYKIYLEKALTAIAAEGGK